MAGSLRMMEPKRLKSVGREVSCLGSLMQLSSELYSEVLVFYFWSNSFCLHCTSARIKCYGAIDAVLLWEADYSLMTRNISLIWDILLA